MFKNTCKKTSVLSLAMLMLFAATSLFAADTVKLSATIGVIDSGIIPALAKKYEEKTGVKIVYEGAGTGATLDKAKGGSFDMVIVHARALEDKFVSDGYGIDRRDVLYNDFIILGPKSDPAKIKGMSSASMAFIKIALDHAPFVSRADNSGTHVKEMEIWAKAKFTPSAENDDWYTAFSLGKLGNTASLIFADKRAAYIMMDRATYLAQKKNIKLVPLVQGDPILLNYIASIQVNPAKFPNVNAKGAKAFIDWLCSDEVQQIIRDYEVKKYGEPLFFPNSNEWNAKHKK